MRIAIITFSDFNTNYGSMLQAYALYQYLQKQGHTVTEIRYREFSKTSKQSGPIKEEILFFLKTYYKRVLRAIKYKDIQRTKENFENFKRTSFIYTDLLVTHEDLIRDAADFDAYICGSDQIWNIECLGGLRTPYFLDFAPDEAIKLSYAASAGGYHFKESEKDSIRMLLNRFEAVSVRERSDVAEIQDLTTRKVHNVCDPVFLLSANQWRQLAGQSPIQGEYGVCYFVRRSNFGKHMVQTLANTRKMPIYNLSDNCIYIPGTDSRYISVGPLDFVSIISGAKFTVGTSFHLAAFSILFDIPVYSVGLPSNKSRIGDLLEMVDRRDHYIEAESDLSHIITNYPVLLYNHEKMNAFIDSSKLFLYNSLTDK